MGVPPPPPPPSRGSSPAPSPAMGSPQPMDELVKPCRICGKESDAKNYPHITLSMNVSYRQMSKIYFCFGCFEDAAGPDYVRTLVQQYMSKRLTEKLGDGDRKRMKGIMNRLEELGY